MIPCLFRKLRFKLTMFSCESKSMNSVFILEAIVLTSSADTFESNYFIEITNHFIVTSCIVSENDFAMLTKYLTGSCPEIRHGNDKICEFVLGHLDLMRAPSG